ncbi:hypothetical protein BSKO_11903 [Bryopsis sp. KO-2023]|nr:hypothetical protein BSKO_11903 [Bryopsis sp. KO-2023]
MAEGSSVSKPPCGICFETEIAEWGGLDGCAHRFCWGCTRQWLVVDSRCPLCKEEVTRVTKKVAGEGGALEVALPMEWLDVAPCRQVCDDEGDNPFDVDADAIICEVCNDGGDEHILLICDGCQRGFHTRCVGLPEVPEDDYYCHDCAPSVVLPPLAVPQPPPVPAQPVPPAPSSVPAVHDAEDDAQGSLEDKSESPEEDPVPVRRPRPRGPRFSARMNSGRRERVDARRSPRQDGVASRTRLATSRNRGVASRTRQATRLAEDATRIRNTTRARRDRPISEGLLRRHRARNSPERPRRQTRVSSSDSEASNDVGEENQQEASNPPASRSASPRPEQPETINLISTDDSPETSVNSQGTSSIKISDLRRQFEVAKEPDTQPRGSLSRPSQGAPSRPSAPAGRSVQGLLSTLMRKSQGPEEGLFNIPEMEGDAAEQSPPRRSGFSNPRRGSINDLGVKCLAEGRILSRREEQLRQRIASRRSNEEKGKAPVEDLWQFACGRSTRMDVMQTRSGRNKRSRDQEEDELEGPVIRTKLPRREGSPSRVAGASPAGARVGRSHIPPAGANQSDAGPPAGPSGSGAADNSFARRLLSQDLQILKRKVDYAAEQLLRGAQRHRLYSEVFQELSNSVYGHLEQEMLAGASPESVTSTERIDAAIAAFSEPVWAKLI